MNYLGISAEDNSMWIVPAESEEDARSLLGDAVGSDGDEFRVIPLPLFLTEAVKIADGNS